ncbi:sugar ABC transporter ATP-binding protein [Candidatus Amarolinea aalborgensis]|jgi:ABC-type sugar transport system ATPase subunit|uniref:sugar ABC transporter ATP-binding protein n=1 Tax=Candidatus Amarolinea aalborgensis TaxID=2249329 RepID=UPI003BFA2367
MSESPGKILLEMKGIGKTFPGVKALEGVSLTIREGQVHALLGENGAGKSTLIKILSGAYTKDEGEIFFEGKPVDIRGPQDAQALGISTIYQEFNLARDLTVAENIFLGHLPRKGLSVDWAQVKKRSREILDTLGVELSVETVVSTLAVAEQQLVEIAKSLNRKTRILIMDEPSAVLGEKDLEKLFQVVRSLQAQGIGIVYISHRLKEIFELADQVTVLKDGRYIDTRNVSEVTMDDLVKLMIGRDLKDVYPKRAPVLGEVLLEVKNVSRTKLVHDISFELHAGEIVGFAGITGSGRTELARAIFGADPYTGEMRISGQPYRASSPQDAIRHGVALVTEDRKAQGLFLKLNVAFNTTISGLKQLCRWGVIQLPRELNLVKKMIQDLSIKTPGPNFIVVNMSGGNQQKVVLARWLSIGTRIFIMDEPTRGIDVGSKSEIYQIMDDLTKKGVGVIMISSELPEVLGMSDRIMVMRQGTIVKELSRAEASEEAIMKYAVGSEAA